MKTTYNGRLPWEFTLPARIRAEQVARATRALYVLDETERRSLAESVLAEDRSC